MHIVNGTVVVIGAHIVNITHNLHSLDNLSKDRVLTIKMRGASILTVMVTDILSHLHIALRCLIYAFLHSVEGQLAKCCAIDDVEV